MKASMDFASRAVYCLFLAAAIAIYLTASGEAAVTYDPSDSSTHTEWVDKYDPVPSTREAAGAKREFDAGVDPNHPKPARELDLPDLYVLPYCDNLAHELGKAGQVSPLTKEEYEGLVKQYGKTALPEGIGDGYRYCWECKHECNGKRTLEYSCVWTDFKWNVKGTTYPKCAPAPAPAGGNTALPSKPRAPTSDEVKRIKAKAEQGDADSQYQLGLLYRDGLGVSKDLQKAGEWFSRAAMLGHKAAKQELEK